MGPFKKKFKKEYAKTLLSISVSDVNSAELLAKANDPRKENIVYLAQQEVEKAIKAVMCHYDLEIPMTHDLAALLGMLPDALEKPKRSELLVHLTEYATIRRYEEGIYEYTTAEIQSVVDTAKQVCQWAKESIK